MIKGRSALESLSMFGLVNDGPLNQGGLGVKKAAPVVPGVTTADKLVSTPKPVKRNAKSKNVTPDRNVTEENVTRNAEIVTPSVTEPMTSAERQKAYRLRKAEQKGKA